jgi:hypothetical protein
MCQDVEEAMAPVQAVAARPDAESHASAQPVSRMGLISVVDVPARLAAQDAVFEDSLH